MWTERNTIKRNRKLLPNLSIISLDTYFTLWNRLYILCLRLDSNDIHTLNPVPNSICFANPFFSRVL